MVKIVKRARVLIVEDEVKLANLLDDYLRKWGYGIDILHDGTAVAEWVNENDIDLILLDLMLPGKDGVDVCREVRAFSSVPIIMTTARVEEIDRLLGLELGADDYICKPYYPREVVARVKALLRRTQAHVEKTPPAGRLILDEDTYAARLDGIEIRLTRVELRLLGSLMARLGKICSRDTLTNSLYDDYRIVSDRTVDTHIKNLRRKLAKVAGEHEFIRSIYGVGYVLELPD